MLVRFFITLSLCVLGLVLARPAFAWEVCNETSYILRVAAVTSIDGELEPKGWSRADPGQCFEVSTAEGQPRYVYAESSAAHQGGIREWRGVHNFCAANEDFTARNDISCALQGMGSRDYISVDPSEQTTILTEPRDYGSNAVTAGLQRLLQDNGYKIATIDGIAGRQTSRDLLAFLRSKDLPNSVPDAQKLSVLEQAALEKQSDIGIHVCNEADQRIWIATAYRFGASWESRGWWPAEPGSCVHAHTASIRNIDAHVFALLETSPLESEAAASGDISPEDLILKSNAAVPARFCIAESRFSATDRENCSARGYNAASFRPLPSDQDGIRLTLSNAEFSAKNIGGLRQ